MIGSGATAAASFSQGRASGLDVSAAAAAWAAARASGDASSFLVVSVDHAAKRAAVAAAGTGGYAALRAHLAAAPPTAALFGAFPYSSKGLARFAFFCYLPPLLAGMARGRVSLQRAAVYAAFEGVVGDLTLEEDLGEAAVVAALQRVPGAADVAL